MKVGIAPRLTAAGVVGRVIREGAWTQQALAPVTAVLSDLDRRQAEALTFGTIRRLQSIDRGIGLAASRPLEEIEPGVLDALRIATFELWFGRAPTAVAADTGVEVVRSISGRAAGFANALLRRLARGEPDLGTGLEARSLELGLPAWLVAELDEALGRRRDDFICPRLHVRRTGFGPAPAPELRYRWEPRFRVCLTPTRSNPGSSGTINSRIRHRSRSATRSKPVPGTGSPTWPQPRGARPCT